MNTTTAEKTKLQIQIDELIELENKIRVLSEKREEKRARILEQMEEENISTAETEGFRVEIKPKYTYCYDDKVWEYCRDSKILNYFIPAPSITETKLKELLKAKQITPAQQLDINRFKYIAEQKNVLYLRSGI